MWLNIAVALLVLVTFLLATFVLVRSREGVNRSFAILAYALTLWIVVNYIGANFKQYYFARYFTHADFLLGAVAVLYFWVFTRVLLNQTDTPKKYISWIHKLRVPHFALATTAVLITFSPFTASVDVHQNSGTYNVTYGSGYDLYGLVLLLLLLSGVANIALALRHTTGVFHRQIITISRGLIAAVAFIAVANLVLPFLTPAANINLIAGNVSYLGIVIFVVCAAYAIIRHKLFDIRFFVVRAIVYMLSVALLALFCLVPVAWLISHFLNIHISTLAFSGIVLLGAISAIMYQYLRRIFDRLTLRIFYRQYYDPQDVLDRLSDVLVRSIDMDWLQEKSRQIIATALSVKVFDYWLVGTGYKEEFADLKRLFALDNGQGVIILDEVLTHKDIVGRLRQKNVAAVVKLRTTHGELGYMVLGFKESGSVYTQQDKRLLSTVSDEIAISIQNALHFEEIQNFNKTLQVRVQKATAELRRANERLKQLDQTKDDFISMASHQLRTPLTSIKGYLSMVLEGDAGKLNSNQQQLLQQSFDSAQRMVYLISDLLNLSRLSTGKFVIEAVPIDLSEVVQAEFEQLQETAKSREVTLTYQRPANFPKLMLDETKTHQVVMNLMDNAIYYTPAGGSVTVEVRETPAAVEYTVKDTGIGVPKAVQHRLFTKFYRAQNAQQARPDGTGLGLFMVRKTIAAQGGSIIFQSQEGKGSTFGFRFSKASHQPPAAELSAGVKPDR